MNYLVDGRADELAAEHNVTEQDGEVAARLRVLRLLVQHEPRYGHQVRPVSIRRVIHLRSARFFSFLSFSAVRGFSPRLVLGSRERIMNWEEGWGWAYLEETEVSDNTWRAWSERVSEWSSLPSADNAFRPLPFSDSASIRRLSGFCQYLSLLLFFCQCLSLPLSP